MILTFKERVLINNDLFYNPPIQIVISDADADSLREQLGVKEINPAKSMGLEKKEHKWKEGNKVVLKECCRGENFTGYIEKDDNDKLYVRYNFVSCYNPEHWTLIEESGVRSPEQNTKEIEQLSYELENPMLSIIYKCNELCDAVNLLRNNNH